MKTTKRLIGAIILITFVPLAWFTAGPQLVAEWQAGDDWDPALELRVTHAHCTRYEGIVSYCSISYESTTKPSVVFDQLQYLVFGSWGGEHIILLKSRSHPQTVTTSQAIRDLTNRVAAFVVFMGLAGAISSFGIFALFFKRGTKTKTVAG